MSRRPLSFVSCLFLVLAMTGCGATNIAEHRTYLARTTDTGEFSLFRVSVSGNAKMAAIKYGAGWQKAEAVDEIFKNVLAPPGGTEPDLYAPIREAQAERIEKLAKKLESLDLDDGDFETIEDGLVQTLTLERRLKGRETSASPEAPAEKFVIVLSADPEKVFEEIAAVVDRQRNEGAVLKTVQALKKQEGEAASSGEKATQMFWATIEASFPDLQISLAENADDQAVTTAAETARANLTKLKQRLKEFVEAKQ